MVVFFYLSIQKTDSRAEKNSSCWKDGRFCSEKTLQSKKKTFSAQKCHVSSVNSAGSADSAYSILSTVH